MIFVIIPWSSESHVKLPRYDESAISMVEPVLPNLGILDSDFALMG
jgi:hypothetical protein